MVALLGPPFPSEEPEDGLLVRRSFTATLKSTSTLKISFSAELHFPTPLRVEFRGAMVDGSAMVRHLSNGCQAFVTSATPKVLVVIIQATLVTR